MMTGDGCARVQWSRGTGEAAMANEPGSGPGAGAGVVPLAYVTRSGFVEGVHHGSAVALDHAGDELIARGEPGAVVLPRSALKPLQLVAMVRAGLVLPGPLLAL